MKKTTKKWLTVTGCLMVCAVLVFIITGRFAKEPVSDTLLDTPIMLEDEVTVAGPDENMETKGYATTEKAATPPTASQTPDAHLKEDTGSGADAVGTEQTIQADPEKPQPEEEALKDPTQKPDGTPVEGSPEAVDHEHVTPPEIPSVNPNGGLPGFENVPDAGSNQGEQLEDMYENGNKIGFMG